MKTIKSGRKPCVVVEIERKQIYDFKDLAEKQNWEKDTKECKVYLSKIYEIRTKGYHGNKVPFLYAFNADYNELCINKQSKGRSLSLVNYNLNNAYRTLLHVHPLELKDLLVLLKKGSIPSTRHAFYQFLFEANEGDTNESSYRKRVIVLISIRLLR